MNSVTFSNGDSNSSSPSSSPSPPPLFSLCRSLPMRAKQKAGSLALGSFQDRPCRSGNPMLKNVTSVTLDILCHMWHKVKSARIIVSQYIILQTNFPPDGALFQKSPPPKSPDWRCER